MLHGQMSSVVFDRRGLSENMVKIWVVFVLLVKEKANHAVWIWHIIRLVGAAAKRVENREITCPGNHTKHIFVEGIFNAAAGFLRRHRRVVSGRLKHRHSVKRLTRSSYSVPQSCMYDQIKMESWHFTKMGVCFLLFVRWKKIEKKKSIKIRKIN